MAMNMTEVRLLAVPLENDYKHTVYFADKDTQLNYFLSRSVHWSPGLSYQRKEKVIRFPKHFDELQNCNYLMYRNNSYSDKWFYGFITDMEYINDERTDITFELDVLQTYMFDYTVQPSFVEREHCTSDGVGENTVPENLETGEYVTNSHHPDTAMQNSISNMCYIIGATTRPIVGDADDTPAGSGIYNGVYSGVKYYRYDTTDAVDIVLEIYAKSGKTDSITGIFMCPKWLAPLGEDGADRNVADSTSPAILNSSIAKQTGLNGYTPRNKKLLTFPYCYLLVDNNNGGSAIYKQEYFSDETCKFNINGALTPGCSIRLVPVNYKGDGQNDEEGLNLGKFPICNFTSDMYTNWLTQNSVNIGLNIASGAVQIVGGVAGAIATGGIGGMIGGGAVVSGVSTIANQLAQIHEQQFVAPQVRGNTNCGDVVTASGKNTFHYYRMSIKKEFAKIIDGYFDMFGYKCNLVKTPAKAHRKSYWYTKTLDVSIDGNIPMKYMQKIKNAYNNGITFWRHNVTIGNYNQDNAIV